MSRIALWVVLALAILGGGYYFYSRNSTSTSGGSVQNNQANVETGSQAESDIFEGNLNDLIKRGGNYKCSWSFNESGTSMQGTTYMSGRKFAGEATAKTGATDLLMRMVGDGTTIYNWVSVGGFTSGTKFNYSELNRDKELTEEDKKNAQQAFQKMNYDCSPWTPDPAKFVIPTDINFTSTTR